MNNYDILNILSSSLLLNILEKFETLFLYRSSGFRFHGEAIFIRRGEAILPECL